MRRILSTLLMLVLLAGCGGGGGAISPIPDAHAAEPVSGCPVGDATAQLQAMVDNAKGMLELPPCVFNTSARIVISKPLRLVGSSATVDGTIIRSTADEGVVVDPAIKISIAMAPNKRGWWGSIENLRIEPAVNGAGKHALVIRVRPGFFVSTWQVARVHLGDFGEAGLYLDNSAGNADGIFTGQVTRSFIENGVKAVLIGDSVTFDGNVVTNGPSRFTKGLPGFDVSQVPGTAEVVIRENNITTGGGCILIRNGTGVGILNNWCESSSAGNSAGLIQMTNCAECTIRDNRVQSLGGDALYALAFDGGELNVIDSNKLNIGKAGHIAFVNGSKLNKLLGLNRFIGAEDVLYGRITGAAAGLVLN